MNGIGREQHAAAQRLHEMLSTSPVGERWERMIRLHAHEIEQLLAVDTTIQGDVAAALTLLDSGRLLDQETCAAIGRVLDDLHRHAGIALQRDIVRLRDEMQLAVGRTLDELLAEQDPRPSLV